MVRTHTLRADIHIPEGECVRQNRGTVMVLPFRKKTAETSQGTQDKANEAHERIAADSHDAHYTLLRAARQAHDSQNCTHERCELCGRG